MIQSIRPGSPEPKHPAHEPGAIPAERALVVVSHAHPAEPALMARTRPSSAFVAQLIATAQHAPQTRERRRAAPADAALSYGMANELRPSPPAQTHRFL